MSIQHVIGNGDPVETGYAETKADKSSAVVTVEGLLSAIKRLNPASYVPAGMDLDSSSIRSNNDGTGVLTINCISYESAIIIFFIIMTCHYSVKNCVKPLSRSNSSCHSIKFFF